MQESEAADEKLYDLSLTGEGISVTQKISQVIAYRVVAVLMGGASASAVGSHAGRAATVASTGGAALPTTIGQSLREYMDSVGAKRNPEKILAIAKYLTDNENRNVNRGEVKAEFRGAAEPVPGNYLRDFRWAVQVGWLAEDRQSRGYYYVTSAGDDALRDKFSSEIRKRTKIGMGGRRRRRRRTGSTTSTVHEQNPE